VPGDHCIAQGSFVLDAEARRLVLDELVHLLKRSLVQENFETFPGGELALLVLARYRTLASRVQRFLA
jgi:hypothetical protein